MQTLKFDDLIPGFKKNAIVLQKRPSGFFTGPWTAKFEIVYVDKAKGVALIQGTDNCTFELHPYTKEQFENNDFFREAT